MLCNVVYWGSICKTAFFFVGQTKIELLESTDPDGPIGSFLEKRGEGIHYIAFAVDNADEALIDAKEKGFALIDRRSGKGAENMNIGFLHPKIDTWYPSRIMLKIDLIHLIWKSKDL